MKHQSCSKVWLQLTKYNVVSVEIQDSSGSSQYAPIQSGYQRKVVKTKTFLDPNFCLFQDGDLYLPFEEKQNKRVQNNCLCKRGYLNMPQLDCISMEIKKRL